MRQMGISIAALCFALLGGCGREDNNGVGPVDPIPGPTGAVSPLGNDVPSGRAQGELWGGSAGDKGGVSAGKAAESGMPPEGSGTGKSVQESSAHGSTKMEEKASRKQ